MSKNNTEITENDTEKSRQNKNFVQFYRPFLDEIAQLGSDNPVALKIFMFISKHMDNNNALCVSVNALTEILGYSRQTIHKAIKYLKEQGWVCIIKSGTSNVYILNPDIVWTSYDGQKQYCKFSTNVIVTPQENAEYLANVKASFKFKHIDDEFIKGIQEKNKAYARNFDVETGEIYDTDAPKCPVNDDMQVEGQLSLDDVKMA